LFALKKILLSAKYQKRRCVATAAAQFFKE